MKLGMMKRVEVEAKTIQIYAKIRDWCKENGIELSTEATHGK